MAVGNSVVPYVDDTWDNAFRHDRDETYSGSDEKSLLQKKIKQSVIFKQEFKALDTP